MKTTYQPFIIEQGDKVLELLKEDIVINDRSKELIYSLLTEKFIEGNLNEGVEVFDSTDELNFFIHRCNVQEDLVSLQQKGLIDSFDDNESFFLTKRGKLCSEKLFGKKS